MVEKVQLNTRACSNSYVHIMHTLLLLYIHMHMHCMSGVWSTHQGFLKGPIRSMDDLLRSCYTVREVYSSDNLYRCIETHTAHSVPTLWCTFLHLQ